MRNFILVLVVAVVAVYNIAGLVGVCALLLGLTAWAGVCGIIWYRNWYNTTPEFDVTPTTNPDTEGSIRCPIQRIGENEVGDLVWPDHFFPCCESSTCVTGSPTQCELCDTQNTDGDGLAMEDEAEGQYHFTALPLALACHRPESERPNVKEEREALIFVLQLWIYS